MPNPQTNTSKFEMQQTSGNCKVVDGMNVGEISKAFTMVNEKMVKVCAIVN